jgi:hypothetical protein
MKMSYVCVGLAMVAMATIGLFTPGCGGGDDTTVVTNVVAAPLPAEIILDSKTLSIAGGGGAADTTPAAAPTSGVITATATWSGGSNMVAALYRDGAVQGLITDSSPLVLTANTAAGASWYARVINNNSVAITVNIVVSLTP